MNNLSGFSHRLLEIAKHSLSDEGNIPPAFTVGLCVFMVLMHIAGFFWPLKQKYALDPWAPYNLEFHKLSMYPLVHIGFTHLLMNIACLIGVLSPYERKHGTVHCGIVLNTLATVTAIPYCLLGMLLWPETSVLGASAWCFSLIGFVTYGSTVHIPITATFGVPQWSTPFIMMVMIAIIFPMSSFMGHLLGLGAGYLLRMGYLRFMVEPPSPVVQWIESKLDPLISLIPSQLVYYREATMKPLRDQPAETTVLPLTQVAQAAATETPFQGEGHVLGR